MCKSTLETCGAIDVEYICDVWAAANTSEDWDDLSNHFHSCALFLTLPEYHELALLASLAYWRSIDR
jgi:hypothetical protein